jgi:glycosyltransferase involved in cell wall biosynthesis
MPLALSVVVPVKDEAGNAAPLAREIAIALTGEAHEILFIDDGSTDDTAARAEQAGARVIRHPYNKGNGAAVKTGIRGARGEFIMQVHKGKAHAAPSRVVAQTCVDV